MRKLFSRNDKSAMLVARHLEILQNSPLLDPVWYRQAYPDLRDPHLDVARHYLERGAREGRNPYPYFDTRFYLNKYPDVAASGMNPLVHFILHGAKEGRNPRPIPADGTTRKPIDATNVEPNQRLIADIFLITKSDLFDPHYYLTKNPDVRSKNLDPVSHYVTLGWKEGRQPSALFDGTEYLRNNSDVRASGRNPLVHWLRCGRSEGRPFPHAKRSSDTSQRLLDLQNELAEQQADLLATLDREIELRSELNATREREVASETRGRKLEGRIRSALETVGALQASIAEADHLAWIKEGEARERERRREETIAHGVAEIARLTAQLDAVAADLREAVARHDAEVRDLTAQFDAATRDAAAAREQLDEQARAHDAVVADLRAKLDAAVARHDAEVQDPAGGVEAGQADPAHERASLREGTSPYSRLAEQGSGADQQGSMLMRDRVQSLNGQMALLEEPEDSVDPLE